MNVSFRAIWHQISKSKAHRDEYARASFKRSVPLQVRALRLSRGWTQWDLADSAKLSQGVVSRAENANYGNLTVNTILSIAAGFDCAFVGRFVPFSELARWMANVSESTIKAAGFDEEVSRISEEMQRSSCATTHVSYYDQFLAIAGNVNGIQEASRRLAMTQVHSDAPRVYSIGIFTAAKGATEGYDHAKNGSLAS